MSVREILTVGHPLLRERSREVTADELASPAVQTLIDDLIDTMHQANGAGIAAPQIGELLRIATIEVNHNPRYPYKPPIPLTVVVNPVIDIVERWADESPDDVALVSLDGEGGVVAEQTAADLARDARRAARALLALGIKKGDPVFIMLPRVPAWYAAMLGVIRIGAIAMPGTNQLTSKDIAYRIRSADASVQPVARPLLMA